VSATLENLMTIGAAAAYERNAAPTDAERESALSRADARVTFADGLVDELLEVAPELDAAIRAGDALLIGQIVLAVRRAHVHALAVRELDTRECVASAKQAAATAHLLRKVAS